MTTKKKDLKADALKRAGEIDKEMAKLAKEKQGLAKVLSTAEPEVSLNQLNLIARYGAKKAKEVLGDSWVE